MNACKSVHGCVLRHVYMCLEKKMVHQNANLKLNDND